MVIQNFGGQTRCIMVDVQMENTDTMKLRREPCLTIYQASDQHQFAPDSIHTLSREKVYES